MSSPAITLHEPPTPVKFFRETAILLTVAFSGDPIDRWCSVNGDEPIMEKEEDIPDDRLRKDIRGIAHEELRPNIIPVTALLDGEVAGFAVWETGDTKASHNLFTARPSIEWTHGTIGSTQRQGSEGIEES